MKTSPRNYLFGYGRIVFLSVFGLIFVLLIFFMVHWQPAKTIKRQQKAFLKAVESKKPARIRRLMSDSYRDRWGFTSDDIIESFTDVSGQFLAITIEPESENLNLNGKTGTISSRYQIKGRALGPGGTAAMQKINRLKEPFIFTWEKQSFLPSSWRLIAIENKAIPDDVWGYEPGAIRRAIDNL